MQSEKLKIKERESKQRPNGYQMVTKWPYLISISLFTTVAFLIQVYPSIQTYHLLLRSASLNGNKIQL